MSRERATLLVRRAIGVLSIPAALAAFLDHEGMASQFLALLIVTWAAPLSGSNFGKDAGELFTYSAALVCLILYLFAFTQAALAL